MKRLWQHLHLSSWELLALVLLTSLSLFLRLYHLGETLPFTYDQGRDMLVLQEMQHGDVKLVGPTTGIGGLFLGPFYYYFLLPGFVLTQGSPIGVAVWNAVIISLSLVLFYFLLRPVVGSKWALLGYAWLVIVPGALENARIIWNPSLTVSTLLVSTWALFASRQKPWLLSLGLLAYGLCLQTELAYAVFLAPAYAVWVLAYGPWAGERRRYSWPVLVAGCVSFGLTLLPQLAFELKNNFLMTKSVLSELGDSSKTATWQFVLQSRPGLIFQELGRLLFANTTGTPWLTVAVTSLAITLALKIQKTAEQRWWLACLALPLLGMMLFRGNNGAFFSYYLSAHYLPVIATVLLAVATLPLAVPKLKLPVRPISAALVSLALVVGLVKYWPLIAKPEVFNYTIQHQIQAVQHILDAQPDRPQAWDVFVPNLQPTQYQYLYQWLSRQQGLSGAPLLVTDQDQSYYLISEPAFAGGSQLSYDDWRKRSTQNVTCQIDKQYGIVTVEKCQR